MAARWPRQRRRARVSAVAAVEMMISPLIVPPPPPRIATFEAPDAAGARGAQGVAAGLAAEKVPLRLLGELVQGEPERPRERRRNEARRNREARQTTEQRVPRDPHAEVQAEQDVVHP